MKYAMPLPYNYTSEVSFTIMHSLEIHNTIMICGGSCVMGLGNKNIYLPDFYLDI